MSRCVLFTVFKCFVVVGLCLRVIKVAELYVITRHYPLTAVTFPLLMTIFFVQSLFSLIFRRPQFPPRILLIFRLLASLSSPRFFLLQQHFKSHLHETQAAAAAS